MSSTPRSPATLDGRLLVAWLDEIGASRYGPDALELLDHHGARARSKLNESQRSPRNEVTPIGWPEGGSYFEELVKADATIAESNKRLMLVDVRSLRVRQIAVATAHSLDDATNTMSQLELASITVPLRLRTAPITAYDERSNSWIIQAPDSSLEVVGRYNGPVEATSSSSQGFGFVVSAQPSRLDIVEVEGKLVILDGHHRALALLRKGIFVVPALVRTGTRREISLDDGIDIEQVLADSAPYLADYLDDDLSVSMPITPSVKVIVLQASELMMPVI